MTTDTEGKS